MVVCTCLQQEEFIHTTKKQKSTKNQLRATHHLFYKLKYKKENVGI